MFSEQPMIIFGEPKYKIDGVYELWNTVSNLSYIIVGFKMIDRKSPLAVPVIMVGIFSAIFHSTGSLAGEILDEMGIILLMYFILIKTGYRSRLWFIVPNTIYLFGIYLHNFSVFYTILTLQTFCVIIRLKQISDMVGDKLFFKRVICYLFVSKIFWVLDQLNYFWIGHSIWHILSAISIRNADLLIDLKNSQTIKNEKRK